MCRCRRITAMSTDDRVSEVEPARRRRWIWAIGLMALLVLLGAMLTPPIAFRIRHAAELRKVQEEVARIQAAGEPITIEDRYAHFKVPDGVRDITPLWQAAFDAVDKRAFREDSRDLPMVDNSRPDYLPPDQLVAAEEFLAKYDMAIQRVFSAAQSPGECRFPVKLEEGYFALLPHADKLSPIHSLLRWRGRVAMAHGNAEKAIGSIEAHLAAARSLAHPSTAVEYLVSLRTSNEALREIEFLVNEMELTDDQLSRLQMYVQDIDFVQSGLMLALIGERGAGYFAFHHPEQIPETDVVGGLSMISVPENPAATGPGALEAPADCLVFLAFMRDIIAAGREPFPGALDLGEQIEARFAALLKTNGSGKADDAKVTLEILPAFMQIFQEAGHTLALRDLTASAIAARRHELKQGERPRSLAELVPDLLKQVPSDPFDGKPLRMVATKDDIVLYSIGKDRRDDGGRQSAERDEPSDIVIRLRMTEE